MLGKQTNVKIKSHRPFIIDDALKESFSRILNGTGYGRRSFVGIRKVGDKSVGIKDIVSRGAGRLDYWLGESLVNQIITKSDRKRINEIVSSLAEDIEVTFHIMVVHPGAVTQDFHTDDDEANIYYTLLFPLTDDQPEAGYTEFEDYIIKPPKRGQCLVFDGKTWHRGMANTSTTARIFMYVVVKSLYQEDANVIVKHNSRLLRRERLKYVKSYEDEELGTIKVGDFYEFYAEEVAGLKLNDEYHWVGQIDYIIHIKREKYRLLGVRWLYSCPEAGLSGNPFEQLFSIHFDELEHKSIMRKVSVAFYHSKPEKYREADFHCWRSYDHKTKEWIPNENLKEHFSSLNKDELSLWRGIDRLLPFAKRPKQ